MEKAIKRSELFGAAAREGGKLALQLFDGFGEVAAAFAKPKRRLPPAPTGWVRPPNALAEEAFLAACTKCGDCLTACPHYVLRKLGPEAGPRQAQTPVLIPRENPCLLCDGLPCASACGTGALTKPVLGAKARMPVARVQAASCYMTQGQPCEYCMSVCPERPKAILAKVPGRAAEVLADACTGCGRCVQTCPTEAVTLEARPS